MPKQVPAAAGTTLSNLIWYCSIGFLPSTLFEAACWCNDIFWQELRFTMGLKNRRYHWYCQLPHDTAESYVFCKFATHGPRDATCWQAATSWKTSCLHPGLNDFQRPEDWGDDISTTWSFARVCILHFFNLLQAVIMVYSIWKNYLYSSIPHPYCIHFANNTARQW